MQASLSLSAVRTLNDKRVISQEMIRAACTDSTFSFLAESNLANQAIEHNDIDIELLNATLYFYINKKRDKGRRTAYQPNQFLFNSCKRIVEKYSGGTLLRFEKKKKRFLNAIKKQAKAANFHGNYLKGYCDYLPVMKISVKGKYIFDEDYDDGMHLFFHKKKRKKKITKGSRKDLKPIESHTYLSLAELIFKRSKVFNRSAAISGKQYSQLGCYVSVYQKNEKKIPKVKVVWVVGGYRLEGLKEN